MEELLKRLLEAERQAEAEVRQASAERERLIQEALRQAREAEEQFTKGLPLLRAPYTKQALDHAEAAIAELNKKHEERKRQLRDLAEQREQSAIEAAVGILLDPQRI
jgi:V/A-type H+/Na+-transporting ATPase subunit G/H